VFRGTHARRPVGARLWEKKRSLKGSETFRFHNHTSAVL
jgi:hypothetical protein